MSDAEFQTREALASARRMLDQVVRCSKQRDFEPTRKVLDRILTALEALDTRVGQLEGDAA